jgi:hypothetical protein
VRELAAPFGKLRDYAPGDPAFFFGGTGVWRLLTSAAGDNSW